MSKQKSNSYNVTGTKSSKTQNNTQSWEQNKTDRNNNNSKK